MTKSRVKKYRRKDGTPVKAHGRNTGKKTMFFPAKNQYLADIISFESYDASRESATLLLQEYNEAKTQAKKIRIKKATVLASNRAKASMQRTNLSDWKRDELFGISEVYRSAYEIMKVLE